MTAIPRKALALAFALAFSSGAARADAYPNDTEGFHGYLRASLIRLSLIHISEPTRPY